MPDQVRRVTHTRITANQGRDIEKLKRRPFASFDVLEDPVILGANGASLTADPTDVSTGATGYAVAINGRANGAGSVAVGPASALSDYSVSIGNAVVNTLSTGGVSIGNAAQSTGADTVAIGSTAAAAAAGAVSIGKNTSNAKANSVAIGTGATTTKVNQIMMGGASHFVEIPGNSATSGLVLKDTATGTRYLVQITSAALVLNVAP